MKAMIHLAHTLGLAVVAEGVETDSQLAQLTSFGCDEAQGFLLGYPEPISTSENAKDGDRCSERGAPVQSLAGS